MTNNDFFTEEDIFELARREAEGWTQSFIAQKLQRAQSSVSKMLNGESKMLSLAIRWLEIKGYHFETGEDGKPVRYFKAVQVLDD